MGITLLAAGPEGEITPTDKSLTTTHATSDARGAYRVPEQSALTKDHGQTYGTLWAHGVVRAVDDNRAFVSGEEFDKFFSIEDASGNVLVCFRWIEKASVSSYQLSVASVTGDTTAITTQDALGTEQDKDSDTTLDLRATVSGATLTYEAYVDGTLVSEGTIAGITPAWGSPQKVSWGVYQDRASLGNRAEWREMATAEESTVGLRLSCLNATAAGTHSGASGSYTDVSENGVATSTVLAFASVGDKYSFEVDPLSGLDLTGRAIQGLVFTFIAKLDAGIAGFRPFVRIGGVDYPGASFIPGASFTSHTVQMTTNPATSSQFTAAEIAAGLEVGIEAV